MLQTLLYCIAALLLLLALAAAALIAFAAYITRPLPAPFNHKIYRPPREPGLFPGLFLQHFRMACSDTQNATDYSLEVAREALSRGDAAIEVFATCISRWIILLDPRDVQHVLVSGAAGNYVKPAIPYGIYDPVLGERGLVAIRDEKLHAQLSQIIRPALNGRCLAYVTENYMPKHAAALCSHLKRRFIDDAAVRDAGSRDIEECFTEWTIGVTTEALFRTVEYHGANLGRTFTAMMDNMTTMFTLSILPRWLREGVVMRLFPSTWGALAKTTHGQAALVRAAAVDMADAARQRGQTEEVKSFVDVIAAHPQMQQDTALLGDTCMTILSASLETTATSALHFTTHMALSPKTQETLFEELKEVVAFGVAPNYDDVKELPYLQACIKESMRISPAVTSVERQALRDDVLPSGVKLRAGDGIAISIYAMHHLQWWGEDAEVFRPERWLDEATASKIPQCAYLPFLHGGRRCIGEKMAMAELSVGLAAMIRRFKIELAPGEEAKLPPKVTGITMRPNPMLKIVLREREE